MVADTNAENLIIRMRFRDIKDEEGNDETAVQFIKEIEDSILNDFTLKGIPEICKVYAKKYPEHDYDLHTGEYKQSNDNWMLETDGIALLKILPIEKVD